LTVSGAGGTGLSGLSNVIGEFVGTANSRGRLLVESANTSGSGRSSEIVFAAENSGGSAILDQWSIGTDLNFNGTNNLYFYNNLASATAMLIDQTGKVGIGTTAPAAPLHVAGEAIVGNTGLACSSTTKGGIRWNNTDLTIEMCDGTNWNRIAAAPPAGCTGPSAFSFTNLTNQSLSTVVTSNTITPSGCATALSVSVSGAGSPQISINGGAWVSSAGMNPGDTIAVRLTSSGSVSTARAAVVLIGSTSSTWTVTTLGGQTQLFITTNGYNANFGGLSGADAVCMSEANAFGYPGTWKAVLSTTTTNARDRLTILYPVVLAGGGATIATTNLWNTLTGSLGGSNYTWTGSLSDGTVYTYYGGPLTCNDWTDGTSSSYGGIGVDETGYEAEWLDYSYDYCSTVFPLYCVNQ
jgi:hypothetical protein